MMNDEKISKLFSNLNVKSTQNVCEDKVVSDENSGLKNGANSRQWYPPNQSLGLIEKNNAVNDFRFDFKIKYDPKIEKKLYPKVHRMFKIDGYYALQKTGSQRTICLLCQIDIGRTSNPCILEHYSGSKHMRNSVNPIFINKFKSYHDIFLNLEPKLQAFQVYFAPEQYDGFLTCTLCKLFVRKHEVVSHILNEPHKTNVLHHKMEYFQNHYFNFIDDHLEFYGIRIEKNHAAKKPKPKNIEEKINDENVPQKEHSRTKSGSYRDHQIVKSIDAQNNELNSFCKWFPRRFEDHFKFLKETNLEPPSFNCTCCKIDNIPKDSVVHHLIQAEHLSESALRTLNYKYYCEICDIELDSEEKWLNHFENKSIRHENVAPSRKDKLEEFECLNCKMVIFGDNVSLKRHKRVEKERNRNKDEKLSKTIELYFASKALIRNKAENLLKEAEIVMESKEQLDQICQDLENCLKPFYPNCKAYPFGSRVSGLGSQKSDLDVFIDVGDTYNSSNNQDSQSQLLILQTALRTFISNKKFNKITSRPTARTPIIKLRHILTKLDCDISFRHGLSVENTKFIRFCFSLQPISQQLILLLKKWLNLCGFCDEITTYAMAMMAIFYLQTENYLLPVKKMKQGDTNLYSNVLIDGWETVSGSIEKDFKKDVRVFDGDIVDLLKGFFEYYSNFDYKDHVICPLMGDTILKKQFTDDLKGGKLPPEMADYVHKINDPTKDPEHFRALSAFCIQDPFDLSHNLTKALGLVVVKKFKKMAEFTFKFLDKLE